MGTWRKQDEPVVMETIVDQSVRRRDHIARIVLCSFLFTFLTSRILVLLIMTRSIPDLYLHVGGNHIHHMNYGIFLLAIAGGWLLFFPPSGRRIEIVAILYGVGLALTFDEFGMWLHLGGSYWQRASWDAVAVTGASLALFAYAPMLARFRPVNWWTTIVLSIVLVAFTLLLWKSFHYAERIAMPKLLEIEAISPP